jgi:hypothetical protein
MYLTRSGGGGFSEGHDQAFSARDIRFTTKGDALYALTLGWPENPTGKDRIADHRREHDLGVVESTLTFRTDLSNTAGRSILVPP